MIADRAQPVVDNEVDLAVDSEALSKRPPCPAPTPRSARVSFASSRRSPRRRTTLKNSAMPPAHIPHRGAGRRRGRASAPAHLEQGALGRSSVTRVEAGRVAARSLRTLIEDERLQRARSGQAHPRTGAMDALLGHDRRDQLRRRHVEGGFARRTRGDLRRVPLLDRDLVAGRASAVERRGWRDDVEREPVVLAPRRRGRTFRPCSPRPRSPRCGRRR